MSTSRDLQFDGLKFLLVFLVVLGHLSFKDYGIGVRRMIYSFHMPVFVFLSGYFTSLSKDKGNQIKWIKKTLSLFICAHVGQYLLRILIVYASCIYNGIEFQLSSVLIWRNFFVYPSFALWYLISLVYWRIIVWAVDDKLKDITVFVVSCVAAIIAGFIPLGNELSFQRTFAFAPFFMLGYFFKKRRLINKLESIPVVYAVLGICLGFIIARKINVYFPVDYYVSWRGAVIRIEQTLLGLFLCLCIIRVSRCRFTEFFAQFGTKTLWIYIGHTFLIILCGRVYHFLGITFNLFTAILVAILYCAFLIIIANGYQSLTRKRNPGMVS